jgi:hypothetical protein
MYSLEFTLIFFNINQYTNWISNTIHGYWIPTVHAGMTALGLVFIFTYQSI